MTIGSIGSAMTQALQQPTPQAPGATTHAAPDSDGDHDGSTARTAAATPGQGQALDVHA